MHPSRYNFSGSKKRNSIGSYLIDAATYEPKRSMSNARLINTVLTLLMAIVLIYSSLFYIPALFNSSMIIGSSTSRDNIQSLDEQADKPWYTPAVNLLHMKRGYFKAGSKIRVAYNSTPGSEVTLYLRQCSGIPVMEIYSCPAGPIHKFKAEGHRGEISLPVHKNGFYYFSQSVKYNQDNGDYVILWGR